MPDKGGFDGFKRGFLLEKGKQKSRSPESRKKSEQLSDTDQQLLFMGIDPKQYYKTKLPDQAQSSSSKAPEKDGGKKRPDRRLDRTDKGKFLDTGEYPIPQLGSEVQRLGGNASLTNAKIICLAGHHVPEHMSCQAKIIDILADSRDIVLVEGIPAYCYIDKKDHQITEGIKKDVDVIGWDDDSLHDQGVEILQAQNEALEKLRSEADTIDEDNCDEGEGFLATYEATLINYKKALDEVSLKRNSILQQVLSLCQQECPHQKIFIQAGTAHFTDDPGLIETLDKHPYIILQPTYEPSQEEIDGYDKFLLSGPEESDRG